MMSSHSKYPILTEPTAIQLLSNLSRQLKGVQIYIKRDDAIPFGLGGNKLRKLEYLMGDAIAKGCDVILTTGGIQSNHARLTAAVASYAGIECELILTQEVAIRSQEYLHNGNILLEKLIGSRIHTLSDNEDATAFMENRKNELIRLGKKPYIIPLGGSNDIGNLGYVKCVDEILDQAKEIGVSFDKIVVANGSGGTHAGLLAGAILNKLDLNIIHSYSVILPWQQACANTFEKAKSLIQLLKADVAISENEINISSEYLGKGYGIPTHEMISVLKLLARTEGIFLDPVYTGKAFAGLLNDIEQGKYNGGSNILFIHTGGIPGLFAYGEHIIF